MAIRWIQLEQSMSASKHYKDKNSWQHQTVLIASGKTSKSKKELEKTLQNRYGDLLVEQERIYNLMEKYRQEAKKTRRNCGKAAHDPAG
ncbi:hypothetical protein OSB04_017069 [Centaurea solstitialis]|uniref:Uncharacterized protein n=1 Tax=Centaurea solstitialis TaxID=347529 RepID=A0AA38WKD5_9ASTR|nr:hypothetical protein OSB04_017069 [Centaurea solstitialis]